MLAVTGHRPKDTGGYGQVSEDKLYTTAHDQLAKIKPDVVGTGMAIGWDQAIAQACIDLKIPFIAFVPFEGQQRMWPRIVQLKYQRMLDNAGEVRIVSKGPYSPRLMQVRNEAMVNWCTNLLALHNGKTEGGTWNCLQYAARRKIPITSCWRAFVSKSQQGELL